MISQYVFLKKVTMLEAIYEVQKLCHKAKAITKGKIMKNSFF
jgi:hypothetical protein